MSPYPVSEFMIMPRSFGKKEYNRRWMKAQRAVKNLFYNEADSDSDTDAETYPFNHFESPSISSDCYVENSDSENAPVANSEAVEQDVYLGCDPEDECPSNFELGAIGDGGSPNEEWEATYGVPLSSESDTESELLEDENDTLKEELKCWANQFQVKHNAIDHLLKVLQDHGHPELPATARTLLQTKRNIDTSIVSGMEYYYLGLRNQLERIYAIRNLEDSIIELILNVDGIPLFKSSSSTLWPVLGAIANISPPHVFPIALTYGHSKPENWDFLSNSISELSDLLENGICIDDKNVTVKLRGVICDAPARAFVKSSKQYSGYYG